MNPRLAVIHVFIFAGAAVPFASAFAPATSSVAALLTSGTVVQMLLERPKAKLQGHERHCRKPER